MSVAFAQKKRERGGVTGSVLQVGSKESRVQSGLCIVEKGVLLGGLDRVDGAKGQPEKPGRGRVLRELGRHLLGGLDGLGIHRQATDGDCVGVNDATGAAAVAVRDAPGRSAERLGGRALAWVVQRLAIDLRGRGQAAEDPEIAGACIKVQVQSLGGCADLHGGQVLDVILLGRVGIRARGPLAVLAAEGVGHVDGDRLAKLPVGLGQGRRAVACEVCVVLCRDGNVSSRRGRRGCGKRSGEAACHDEGDEE